MPAKARRDGSRWAMVPVGWIGLALVAVAGCQRGDPDLEHQANTVERQGDRLAEQLRARADEVVHRASVRADQLRHEAGEGWNSLPSVQPVAPGARGGGPIGLDTARGEYAAARCDREERCNNVGAGRTHSSRSECLTDARNDRRDSWDSAECRQGINSARLSDCLAAVRSQNCNNPMDDLTRLATCRSGEVCGR